MKKVLVLMSSIFLVEQCSGMYNAQAMDRLLDIIGNKGLYRKEVRPGLPPGHNDGVHPLEVTATMYLRNFNEIDVSKGKMESHVTFRQEWVDHRLADVCSKGSGNSTACAQLGGQDVDLVWRPDTFFRNEMDSKVHQDLVRNNYLRVFPGGRVLYSVRMTISSSCPEAISPYPDPALQYNDWQVLINPNTQWKVQNESFSCKMQISSYGWTTDNIKYKWKSYDPVMVSKNIYLPHFTLNAFTTDYCNVKTNTAEYSCLDTMFAFTRVSDPLRDLK